jgi:hypothetical protein
MEYLYSIECRIRLYYYQVKSGGPQIRRRRFSNSRRGDGDMNSEAQENERLARQVQRLQREISFMKTWGAVAAIALLLLVVGLRVSDHHRVSAQQVVAKDFVLIDSDGHARARLAVFPEGAGMEAYAASGERRVQLVGDGEQATLNLYIPVTAVREQASVNLFHNNVLLFSLSSSLNATKLEMHSQPDNGSAILNLEGKSASLTLSGSDDRVPKIRLSASPSEACTTLTGGATPSAGSSLCLHSPGLPSLELADVGGDRAVIGIPQTADLNAEPSSAASLILKHSSGKKVKVTPETK